MSLAESLYKDAKASGELSEGSKYFSVVDKKKVMVEGEEVIIEKSNGNHTVKVLSETIATGKDYNGKDAEQLCLVILDNGAQKTWNVPLKNQDGTLYFLVEKLKDIDYLNGEEFMVRAKKLKNGRFSKEIIRLEKGEEIPTINLDEEESGDDAVGGAGTEKGKDDISEAKIPF